MVGTTASSARRRAAPIDFRSFSHPMMEAREEAEASSELVELTTSGKSNAEDAEEPFDNDECEITEASGSLSPLHIESGAPNQSTTHRSSCPPCERSRSPFHRRRALWLVYTSVLTISAGIALMKRLYPTYSPADAVCLSITLSNDNQLSLSADRLNLNRKAGAFSGAPTNLNGATGGFLWQDDDATTTKWRPQGVTTTVIRGRRFVLVSWYGRKEEGYANRGARISFVDVTAMHSIAAKYSYRHVLLVDEHFCTFPTIHAGGIEERNGLIYVADSRKGQQGIRVFDIETNLFEVPEFLQIELFGYRYVLRSSSFFHVPTKPSFIGFDPDLKMFLVGTYAHCGNAVGMHTDSYTCMSRPENRLVWFEDGGGSVSMKRPKPCSPLFSEMQGAVSVSTDDTTTLLISSSYGPYADSHLHIVRNFDRRSCKMAEGDFQTLHYPAGLEDLHVQEDSKNKHRYLWGLTEFGTRMVFAIPLDALL